MKPEWLLTAGIDFIHQNNKICKVLCPYDRFLMAATHLFSHDKTYEKLEAKILPVGSLWHTKGVATMSKVNHMVIKLGKFCYYDDW